MSRPLAPGDSLCLWEVSDPLETEFPGEARPMPDTLDYRFVNGWVATGDLPCREAWRRHLPARRVALADMTPLTRIHADQSNPLVDFSCFRFRPTLVARWARTVVDSPRAQTARLRLTTCGGVLLWLGTERVAAFEPCRRNDPASTELALPLDAGAQTLTLYVDDLHERDTRCYFRLELLEGEGLSLAIDGVDPERLSRLRRTLSRVRPTRLFHERDALALRLDPEPEPEPEPGPDDDDDDDDDDGRANAPSDPTALPLQIDIDSAGRRITTTARIGTDRDGATTPLVLPEALGAGCAVLTLGARAGRARVGARAAVTVLPDPLALDQPTLAARKRAALAAMCGSPAETPSLALARLGTLGRDARAERAIDAALERVEARHDCADFDLMPLLWIRAACRARLPRALARRLDRAILGFRYWMDEPGNDVMWFWSENHALCFHAAQYLAGDIFAERVFGNANAPGARQRALGLGRLNRWFDAIERDGLVEWNSAAYYPIDLLALFTLMRLAPERTIRERATRLVDEIFAMTALHTLGGVAAGSQGRAYEKELFAGPATELGSIATIAFGGRWYPGHDRASALFALLGHAPPAALERFAAPPPATTLEARYAQGLGRAASLRLWKCDAVQLSSVVAHHGGTPGHQQHVVDVQLAAHPMARCWINHPGDLAVFGEARPSLWAGNGVLPHVTQYRATSLLLFDLDAHPGAVGFTHVFCPREVLDELVTGTHWLFLRAGAGYAAVFGSGPLEPVARGLYAGAEWRLHAARSAWLIAVGSAALHGSFARFRESCLGMRPRFDAASMRLSARLPEGMLSLAPDAPPTLDGHAIDVAPLALSPSVAIDGAAALPWRDALGGLPPLGN